MTTRSEISWEIIENTELHSQKQIRNIRLKLQL